MASRYSPSFASWDNVAGVSNAASDSMLGAANAFNQGATTATTIGNELEKMHNKALKKREEELKAIGERQKEQLWLSSRRSDGSVDAAKYTEGLNALEQTFRSVNQEPNYMNTDVKNLLGDTRIEELYDAEATRRKKNIASAGINARNEAEKQAAQSDGSYNVDLYKKIIADHLKKTEETYGALSDSERAMFDTGTIDSYNASASGSTTANNLGGKEGAMHAQNIKVRIAKAKAEGENFFRELEAQYSNEGIYKQSSIERAMLSKLKELGKQGYSSEELAAFAAEYDRVYTTDVLLQQHQAEIAYNLRQDFYSAKKAVTAVTELVDSSDRLSGFVRGTDGIYQNTALYEKLKPVFKLDPNAEEQFNYLLTAFKDIDEDDKIAENDKNTAKEKALYEFGKKLGKIVTSENYATIAKLRGVDDNKTIEELQAAELAAARMEKDILDAKKQALSAAYGYIFDDTNKGTANTLNDESVSTLDDDDDKTLYEEAAKSVASAMTELHGLGSGDALLLAKSFIRQRINVVKGELDDKSRTLLSAMVDNPFVEEFKMTTLRHFPKLEAKINSLAAAAAKNKGSTTTTKQFSHAANKEIEFVRELKKEDGSISQDVNSALWYLKEAQTRANKLTDPDEQRAVMTVAYENVSPLIFNMLVNVSRELQNDPVLQDALKKFINEEIIHGHGVVWDANTNSEFLGEIGDDLKSTVVRQQLVEGYKYLPPRQRELLDALLGFRAGNYTIGNMFRHAASWF